MLSALEIPGKEESRINPQNQVLQTYHVGGEGAVGADSIRCLLTRVEKVLPELQLSALRLGHQNHEK